MTTKGDPAAPTNTAIEIQPVGKDAGKASEDKSDSGDDGKSGYVSVGCMFGALNHLRRPGVILMWVPMVGYILGLVAFDSIFMQQKDILCAVMAVLLLLAVIDSKSYYDLSAQVDELKKQNKQYKGLNDEHKKANEQQKAANAKQAENNAAQAKHIAAMDQQLEKLAIFETEMNDICSATQRNMADVLGEMKTIYAQFYQMTQFNRAQMKNSEWHFLKSIYNKLEYAGDGEESFVASEYKKFRREIPRKYKQHPNFVIHFPLVKDFEEKVAALDDDEDGDSTKATQDNIYNRMENMFEEFWNDYEKQELLDKNDFMQKTDDIIDAVNKAKEARGKKTDEVVEEKKVWDYANDDETRKGNDIVPRSLTGMQQGWGFKEFARNTLRKDNAQDVMSGGDAEVQQE